MTGYEDKHYEEWLNGLLALLYARMALETMRESIRYQQERYGPLVTYGPRTKPGTGD